MSTARTNPNPRRLAALVKRSLTQRARGVAHFNKSRATLQRAISAGLLVGQPVEIEIVDEEAGIIQKQRFVLVDNFEGEKSGGWATVNRFELKKAAKNPRKSAAAAAAAVEAAVPAAGDALDTSAATTMEAE